MQAIPEISENKIAPFNASFIDAPTNKPIIPAIIMMTIDATVLNFFITYSLQLPIYPSVLN